jgi:glycosyltransferase involved in cell wall biosynthesis
MTAAADPMGSQSSLAAATTPVRTVVVLPVAAPYREPMLAALAARPQLDLRVIYQSERQPSWDVPAGWFATDHGYPAVHLRSWQRARPGRTPILWPRGLERELERSHPQVVVASEYGPAALRALAWARARGAAHVVLTECTSHTDAALHPAQLRLHRWVSRHADHLIAVSSAGRERLLGFGVPQARITVALQPASVELIRAARRRRAEGRVRVLSVGRLVADKNHAMLIEALAGIQDVELELVGAGPGRQALQRRAAALGVPVILRGHLDPPALAQAYADADVFALVSTYEPFGVAVREALAAGLPIVCSQTAGAAGDVAIDGSNAILVDPARSDSVRQALRALIDGPQLRAAFARRSRELDRELDGREVEAFARAVTLAARARDQESSSGSTRVRRRSATSRSP